MLFPMPYPVPLYRTWNLTSYVLNSFTSIAKLTLLNLRKIIGPCCRLTEISTQSYEYELNCVNKLNVYGPHFMVKIYWTASQNVILYKLFCDRVVINWVFHRDWKIKASCLHHQRDDWKVWVNMPVHKNCSALRIMCTSGLHQSNVTRC